MRFALVIALGSPPYLASQLVLDICLEIARIPEAGASILLKAFSTRKSMLADPYVERGADVDGFFTFPPVALAWRLCLDTWGRKGHPIIAFV